MFRLEKEIDRYNKWRSLVLKTQDKLALDEEYSIEEAKRIIEYYGTNKIKKLLLKDLYLTDLDRWLQFEKMAKRELEYQEYIKLDSLCYDLDIEILEVNLF